MKYWLSLFVCVFLLANASADTWIVDDDLGPGVDFADLPPAIAAAAPGDTIRVSAGYYSAFTLDKPMKIMGEVGQYPNMDGASRITSIEAGQRVVLCGFEFGFFFDSQGLTISHCAGNVQLDDCQGGSNLNSIYINECEQVTVSRCVIGPTFWGIGTPCVSVRNSTVVFSECVLSGTKGYPYTQEDGSPGLWAKNSLLYLLASSCIGGDGGDATKPGETPGAGGVGMELKETTLHLFGTIAQAIEGGDGGSHPLGNNGPGASAIWATDSTLIQSGITLIPKDNEPAILKVNTDIMNVEPAVPVLFLTGTGQRGTEIQLKLFGIPGSLYALFYAPRRTLVPVASLYTDLFLDPAVLHFPIVDLIPLHGNKSQSFDIPANPILEGKTLFWQAYVQTPATGDCLSTLAALVIR